MEKRKIPTKNYIILSVLCIGVVLICLYINSWYQMSEEAKMPKGIMIGFLPEVKLEEMDNYLRENPNVILYTSSSTDDSIKRYEKNFHDAIVKKSTANNFVYLDTSVIDQNTLSNTLKSKTSTTIKKNIDYSLSPNVYVFKEGKIEAVLYSKKQALGSKEVIRFVEKWGGME